MTNKRDQLNARGHSLPFIVAGGAAAAVLAITHGFVVLDLAAATAWNYLGGGMTGALLGLFAGASYVVNRPAAFAK